MAGLGLIVAALGILPFALHRLDAWVASRILPSCRAAFPRLNIVVGFAGLLDLGYIAFYA